MGQGRGGDRRSDERQREGLGDRLRPEEDALFEDQMRSLDVRPAHAVRGGRDRRRPGRGKRRRPVTAPPKGVTASTARPEDGDALFLEAMAAWDGPASPAGPEQHTAPASGGHAREPDGSAEVPAVDLRVEDAVFVDAMEHFEPHEESGGEAGAAAGQHLRVHPLGRELARRFVGTPKALRRRIRSGEIQPQAELDLHGQRRDEAERAVAAFLRAAVGEHHEVLRIIVGRGLHSVQGPVLRRAVQDWLTRDHREVVADVVSAPPAYGGEGVWYAFLRRFS